MSKRKKTNTAPEKELDVLEAQLAGTLKPVAPPREVVKRLKKRVHMPAREEIAFRLRDWSSLVFVFGGVMSGMLIIITVARALFYLTRRQAG